MPSTFAQKLEILAQRANKDFKLEEVDGDLQNDDFKIDGYVNNDEVATINLGEGFDSYIGFDTDNDSIADIIGKRFTDSNGVDYADLMDADGGEYIDVLVDSLEISDDIVASVNTILESFENSDKTNDDLIKTINDISNKLSGAKLVEAKKTIINNAPIIGTTGSIIITEEQKEILTNAVKELAKKAPGLAALIMRAINGNQLFALTKSS